MTRPPAQGDLFAPQSPVSAKPHPRAKCRRAGCGHTYSKHHIIRGTDSPGCADYICACLGFIDADDIAPTVKRQATPSEGAYREAYTRGILRAAPQPFAVIGTRVGSILGTVAKAHATADGKPITGQALLAWIEDAACAFRKATSGDPQYWSGWQPFAFAKWQNMRVAIVAKPDAPTRLQPIAPRRPPKKK